MENSDLSRISLKDLSDSVRQIDKQKYPERYQEILEAIVFKQKLKNETLLKRFRPLWWRKFLGWAEVVLGSGGLLLVVIISGMSGLLNELVSFNALTLLIPAVSLVAGIGVLRNMRWSLALSVFVQLLALASIQTETFSWGTEIGPLFDFTYVSDDRFTVSVDLLAFALLIVALRLVIKWENPNKPSEVTASSRTSS